MAVLKQLSHVSLGSIDLERTIAFYRDVLGCCIAHEFRNGAGELYGVFLSCGGGTFLEFFREREVKPKGGMFRHLCFEVESLEGAAEMLRRLGYVPEIRRGRTDRTLQFFIEDPGGNIIEFQELDAESTLYPYAQTASSRNKR